MRYIISKYDVFYTSIFNSTQNLRLFVIAEYKIK